jgi:kynurenine 3-monooxygenase
MSEKIAIVGAGLVGGLQAIYMAQKGFDVTLFERRPDIRTAEIIAGRSINLALSDRGWKALNGAGVEEVIREMAIPMHRRVMHAVDGELTFQPYGKAGQFINSVSRGGLNQELLRAADAYDNVSMYFNEFCTGVDLEQNVLSFKNSKTGDESSHGFDRVFGTDGAFSAVRNRMHRLDRFNYSQTYLTHGYKELIIPPNADGSHKMEVNALHIWPRGEYMLIALPNLDGSYTVTLFFPFEGNPSFGSLDSKEEVKRFFEEVFPDAVPLMPTLLEDYYENPTSSLVMIHCDPWHYEDKVCLMGDAAHAIVPFYGQGMNSGFEDCTYFNEIFEKHNHDWSKALPEYSRVRKPAGDAICELALRNYIEMRDSTANPAFLLQKKIEKRFSAKHPGKWIPLYEQVTFTHIPYETAMAQGEVQDAIMKRVMDRPDIADVWDSQEVEDAILAEL